MKLKQLQNLLTEKVNEIESLVESNLLDDGNTCEESQRICILEAIGTLERRINGIEESDLI